MQTLVALAIVALARGQAGLDSQVLHVPDYAHYLESTQAGVALQQNGVKVQKWNAIGGDEGYHEGTLKPPQFQKLSIPRGISYGMTTPATANTPARTKPIWLTSPAHYVVTKGKAKFRFANGTKVTLKKGEMFYSGAGMKHGPIKAVGGKAVLMVLADFPPKGGKPPSNLPTGSVAPQFVFQPQEDQYGPHPPLGLPDCIKIIRGPGVLAARMEPNCRLPYHFYATGAFYFLTKGALKVGGDIPGKLVTFPSGTARWARPGWAYGPELSGNARTRFLVLGLPPTVGPAPNTPQQVIMDQLAQPAQVIYRNTQFGRSVEPTQTEQPALRQKRARRHLRSNAGDHEETTLLQHPHVMEEEFDSDEL